VLFLTPLQFVHLFCDLSQVYPAVLLMYFVSAEILAGPQAEGSNPTAGPTLLWAGNLFRGKFNHWRASRKEAGRAK